MPLMPKRVKHRKSHKLDWRGKATSGNALAFGEYGLKAIGRGWLRNTQIEACRVSINRSLKKKGKLWIRVFPDVPVTKKPIEVRMGKGKGNPEWWVSIIRPGAMLFELAGVTESVARDSFRLAAAKIGIATKMVIRGKVG